RCALDCLCATREVSTFKRCQQRVDIALLQPPIRIASTLEHAGGQLGLAGLQLLYLLFHRTPRDESVDNHRLVLAAAVGAGGALLLRRRVPPGVVVAHGIGYGRVESGAAGLEPDQQRRPRAALQASYRGATVRGLASDLHV